MKILLKIMVLGLLVMTSACVDDYTDSNPPPKLDGPAIYLLNPTSRAINSTRSDNSVITYITKGEQATFRVNVVDAPGKIASVTTLLSDTVGTVEVAGFTAVTGNETGEFTVVYTPEPDNPLTTFDDNIVNLSVTLKDQQDKSTAPSVVRIKAIACVPSISLDGFWSGVASGVTSESFANGSVEAGEEFSGLKSLVRFQIRTTGGNATVGTNVSVENAAELFISDASFGLYGAQGLAPITGRLKFCESGVVGYKGLNSAGTAFSLQGNHTMAGVINSDGTLSLSFTNDYGDDVSVTLTKVTSF